MKAKLQRSVYEEQIRTALHAHWHASSRRYGRGARFARSISRLGIITNNIIIEVKRILGNGDVWITEYTIAYQGRVAYTVSIMEFHNGKVAHETQYFADPFETPAWRRQWVQQKAALSIVLFTAIGAVSSGR